MLQVSLHELHSGSRSLDDLRKLSKQGELKVAFIRVLDAMSVVAAIAAPTINTPAESGLFVHLK